MGRLQHLGDILVHQESLEANHYCNCIQANCRCVINYALRIIMKVPLKASLVPCQSLCHIPLPPRIPGYHHHYVGPQLLICGFRFFTPKLEVCARNWDHPLQTCHLGQSSAWQSVSNESQASQCNQSGGVIRAISEIKNKVTKRRSAVHQTNNAAAPLHLLRTP